MVTSIQSIGKRTGKPEIWKQDGRWRMIQWSNDIHFKKVIQYSQCFTLNLYLPKIGGLHIFFRDANGGSKFEVWIWMISGKIADNLICKKILKTVTRSESRPYKNILKRSIYSKRWRELHMWYCQVLKFIRKKFIDKSCEGNIKTAYEKHVSSENIYRHFDIVVDDEVLITSTFPQKNIEEIEVLGWITL